VAPDTVRASEDLYVTVWTTGGGCTRGGDGRALGIRRPNHTV
jgi:hypothetical protein